MAMTGLFEETVCQWCKLAILNRLVVWAEQNANHASFHTTADFIALHSFRRLYPTRFAAEHYLQYYCARSSQRGEGASWSHSVNTSSVLTRFKISAIFFVVSGTVTYVCREHASTSGEPAIAERSGFELWRLPNVLAVNLGLANLSYVLVSRML